MGQAFTLMWRGCNFTLEQTRQLFKRYYLCKTIALNPPDIFGLQDTINSTPYKDAKGNIATTQASTTKMSIPDTLQSIATPERENHFFDRFLPSAEKNETTKIQHQKKQLKVASANQGLNFRRRINRLRTNLHSFVLHLHQRIQLQPQNTAFLLQTQANRLRQNQP